MLLITAKSHAVDAVIYFQAQTKGSQASVNIMNCVQKMKGHERIHPEDGMGLINMAVKYIDLGKIYRKGEELTCSHPDGNGHFAFTIKGSETECKFKVQLKPK